MRALKRMAAVTMMVGLLGGPVPTPRGRPARRRPRFYAWHVFKDWLAYRRQAHRGSGRTNERH